MSARVAHLRGIARTLGGLAVDGMIVLTVCLIVAAAALGVLSLLLISLPNTVGGVAIALPVAIALGVIALYLTRTVR